MHAARASTQPAQHAPRRRFDPRGPRDAPRWRAEQVDVLAERRVPVRALRRRHLRKMALRASGVQLREASLRCHSIAQRRRHNAHVPGDPPRSGPRRERSMLEVQAQSAGRFGPTGMAAHHSDNARSRICRGPDCGPVPTPARGPAAPSGAAHGQGDIARVTGMHLDPSHTILNRRDQRRCRRLMGIDHDEEAVLPLRPCQHRTERISLAGIGGEGSLSEPGPRCNRTTQFMCQRRSRLRNAETYV